MKILMVLTSHDQLGNTGLKTSGCTDSQDEIVGKAGAAVINESPASNK
jgi:hypothetical protein